jgi:AcrR family transcriptional regulator
VFNYFRTKEDLFYDRLEAFEEELVAAIRKRAPGERAFARLERGLGDYAIKR